jgi:hypothetical protein
MSWIGKARALVDTETVLVNLNQVRTITVTKVGEDTVRVVLNLGIDNTVELSLTRERYSDLVRKLEVVDIT